MRIVAAMLSSVNTPTALNPKTARKTGTASMKNYWPNQDTLNEEIYPCTWWLLNRFKHVFSRDRFSHSDAEPTPFKLLN
jgi:hypothetical protein